MTDPIPTLDLSSCDHADSSLPKELVHALSTLGCARLIGHGIDTQLIESAFQASHDLFALSDVIKSQYPYQGHASNRGYIGYGQERHDTTSKYDRKETFDIGREHESDYQTPWPKELADTSFRKDLLDYFDHMNQLQLQLLRLIAQGLGMEDDAYFENHCNEQHCNLRLLHYPEEQAASHTVEHWIVRGAKHTDFGTLTLLVQDATGGLRVQTQAGEWISVQPLPNSIMVQVGDMLQQWTGDVLRATPHQVIQPIATGADPATSDTTAITIPERYSIAFFCNANKNVVIEPLALPGFIQNMNYEPIRSCDYLTRRLNETIHCETRDID